MSLDCGEKCRISAPDGISEEKKTMIRIHGYSTNTVVVAMHLGNKMTVRQFKSWLKLTVMEMVELPGMSML